MRKKGGFYLEKKCRYNHSVWSINDIIKFMRVWPFNRFEKKSKNQNWYTRIVTIVINDKMRVSIIVNRHTVPTYKRIF